MGLCEGLGNFRLIEFRQGSIRLRYASTLNPGASLGSISSDQQLLGPVGLGCYQGWGSWMIQSIYKAVSDSARCRAMQQPRRVHNRRNALLLERNIHTHMHAYIHAYPHMHVCMYIGRHVKKIYIYINRGIYLCIYTHNLSIYLPIYLAMYLQFSCLPAPSDHTILELKGLYISTAEARRCYLQVHAGCRLARVYCLSLKPASRGDGASDRRSSRGALTEGS